MRLPISLLLLLTLAAELPADTRRVAEKALRGEFGKLADWRP